MIMMEWLTWADITNFLFNNMNPQKVWIVAWMAVWVAAFPLVLRILIKEHDEDKRKGIIHAEDD